MSPVSMEEQLQGSWMVAKGRVWCRTTEQALCRDSCGSSRRYIGMSRHKATSFIAHRKYSLEHSGRKPWVQKLGPNRGHCHRKLGVERSPSAEKILEDNSMHESKRENWGSNTPKSCHSSGFLWHSHTKKNKSHNELQVTIQHGSNSTPAQLPFTELLLYWEDNTPQFLYLFFL
jgi:hypothetical protein